jgi:uncharacterized peroxidase-related enzyme
MKTFAVPTREEVTPANQEIFDNLKKSLGFTPNLYATMAYSSNGLGRFLAYSNAKTSLNNKEKEVVNLIVSQINGCIYCLSAHTAIGKMNGFTDEQILDFRRGKSDNPKLNVLVRLAADITRNKGRVSDENLNAFYAQGYTNENLIDVILLVSDKTAMNYIHNLTQVPVDFPVAPALEEEPVVMQDECGDTLWDAVLAQHNN